MVGAVAVALLRVAAVAAVRVSVSVVAVAAVGRLGRGSVTVVVAIGGGIVRVLFVLRIGRVILGVDGLLPDLSGLGSCRCGTIIVSDDATSNDNGVLSSRRGTHCCSIFEFQISAVVRGGVV